MVRLSQSVPLRVPDWAFLKNKFSFLFTDSRQSKIWTGYFTSRPAFKAHEREASALLQAGKQVAAMVASGNRGSLDGLSMALGIAQRHDAITGTAKRHVDADYHLMLS